MLRLVTIDLSEADIPAFEAYEAKVLALLPKYGARLELRVRSLDAQIETHLLHFPDRPAFERYLTDPARAALAGDWERCGAQSAVTEVERIGD